MRVRVGKVLLLTLVLLLAGAAALVLLVTQPVVASRSSPPELADAARLRRDVEAISAIVPRNLADPARLDAAADHVKRAWEAAGIAVAEQRFQVGGVPVRNLIARFGPEGGERLVIGAHYDASGPYPGADDNASGAAGLLELGRLLHRHPPRGSVELVAYTLEEPPHFAGPDMGSAVHARTLRAEGARIHGMLSLEMIGCFSDAPRSQGYPIPALRLIYPSRGNFVAVAGRLTDVALVRRVKSAMAGATDLPVRSISAPPRFAGTDLSDNLSYWREGFRAVMVTDTAFYRNERYHTAMDTPDLIDYGRMAKVVTGVFAAALE